MSRAKTHLLSDLPNHDPIKESDCQREPNKHRNDANINIEEH